MQEPLDATITGISQECFRLLMPLQASPRSTDRSLDEKAYSTLRGHTEDLTRLLRGQASIPSQPLRDLRNTCKALLAEAPYSGELQMRCLAMANELERLFDLLLLGETPEDRVPGVPRII